MQLGMTVMGCSLWVVVYGLYFMLDDMQVGKLVIVMGYNDTKNGKNTRDV